MAGASVPFVDLHARASSAVRGIRTGTLATVAMSAVMLAAKRVGLTGELPPMTITDAAADKMPVGFRPPERDRGALASVMHFAFGGLAGGLYGILAKDVVRVVPGALLGILFASGIYAVSYLGWVPALSILPPAHRDRPGRVGTMLVAHWAYGALLGALTARR